MININKPMALKRLIPAAGLLLVSFGAMAGIAEREGAKGLVNAYLAGHGGSLENPPETYPVDIHDTVRICGYCHGMDGNSIQPNIPSLAAQNPLYFVEQMLVFHAEDRYPVFMHGVAQQMSDTKKVAAALYYADLPRTQTMDVNPEKAARGEKFYRNLCAHCHGSEGSGASETYANIRSQRPDYLIITLKRFRDQSFKRKSHEMGAIVGGLSDADIEGLAHYLASLPAPGAGE